MSNVEIFQRYLHAGAISRRPDLVADLFTSDGVYDVPLIPHRLTGRAEIRSGIGAYQQDPPGPVIVEKSSFTLHETTDPATFMAEIDTVLDTPSGERTMSLLWIFRTRDGQIAHLRDYFDPSAIS